MQDLWRVRDSGVSMHDLDDLVEYHRFLKRFRGAEEERMVKDVLYDCQRFRTPPAEDED